MLKDAGLKDSGLKDAAAGDAGAAGDGAVGQAVLDHVAVAAPALADGWELFGGLLGGSWAYGGESPGFWWGQLEYSAGPKVELMTPTGGPDAAFLERFLDDRGPGVHHLNFLVPDLARALATIRAHGIEPVSEGQDSSGWKEAFLHPRDAYGTVIQIAQQAGEPPSCAPPAELGAPRRSCALAVIELRVPSVQAATALFCEALGGQVTSGADGGTAVELGWPNGARLRLAPAADHEGDPRPPQGISYVEFRPDDGMLDGADRAQALDLSGKMGVTVRVRRRPPGR